MTRIVPGGGATIWMGASKGDGMPMRVRPAEPDEKQKRDALEAILSSVSFADANRLKAFLTYIVEETLGGRGAGIRAKTIASDVYGRRPEVGAEQEAIVRVDAGRLRRRLDVYYAEEGSAAPVRIHVLPGGYLPTFELRDVGPSEEPSDAGAGGPYAMARIAGALLCAGGVGLAIGWAVFAPSSETLHAAVAPEGTAAIERVGTIRHSVNQVSSASLLARTFVEEASDLIFPSIDPARLNAAEILCARAIELAPEISDGHACLSLAQAFLAFLMPPGEPRRELLDRATREADLALRIDPAGAYSQMASAWALFAGGDRATALGRARIAVGLAPDQPLLRNFYGMMMVFDGHSAELLTADVPLPGNGPVAQQYHPFIIAAARLLTEEYQDTIDAVEAAVQIEGRTSALMSAIYIAALENTRNGKAAEQSARNLVQSWPASNIGAALPQYFTHDEDVLAIEAPQETVLGRLGRE